MLDWLSPGFQTRSMQVRLLLAVLSTQQPVAQLLERLVWDQEVAGSIPAGLIFMLVVAQGQSTGL